MAHSSHARRQFMTCRYQNNPNDKTKHTIASELTLNCSALIRPVIAFSVLWRWLNTSGNAASNLTQFKLITYRTHDTERSNQPFSVGRWVWDRACTAVVENVRDQIQTRNLTKGMYTESVERYNAVQYNVAASTLIGTGVSRIPKDSTMQSTIYTKRNKLESVRCSAYMHTMLQSSHTLLQEVDWHTVSYSFNSVRCQLTKLLEVGRLDAITDSLTNTCKQWKHRFLFPHVFRRFSSW